jgi:hypothetical protein
LQIRVPVDIDEGQFEAQTRLQAPKGLQHGLT